jgi:hypothetical protein
MDSKHTIKEQILHLLVGSFLFLLIAIIAIFFDFLSSELEHLKVSAITITLLEYTSHALLVTDLVLFFIHVLVSSKALIKEMLK